MLKNIIINLSSHQKDSLKNNKNNYKNNKNLKRDNNKIL